MQKPSPQNVNAPPESDIDPAREVDSCVEKPQCGITLPREIGGRRGAEPTRFGDWEKNGRCIDF